MAHVKPQLHAAEQSAAEAREEWREAQSRAARMVRDQPESWAALHARRAAESTAAELKKAVQALADLKRSLANAEHRLKERAR